MRKRKVITPHSSELWERLNQIIKVESPITIESIRRWCRDVPPYDLQHTLSEMCAARRISVARAWSGDGLTETYRYGDGSIINLFADDEARPRQQPRWRQPSLVI